MKPMPPCFAREYQCASEAKTLTLATKVSEYVQAGDLLALKGDLGAGKSTFARAFIRSLLADRLAEVPSPTFTLVQQYDLPDGGNLYHTDLYRLHDSEEVYELGLDDERAAAILLVEWPDRLPDDWMQGALTLDFQIMDGPLESGDPNDDQPRRITLSGDAMWASRLEGLC